MTQVLARNSIGEVWVVRDPLFGDCGKAKVVDHLTADPRVGAVVRWQGGDNAGHTIVVDGQRIALHAIPSGVVRNRERPVLSVVGRGMVINLTRFFAEIDDLTANGIRVTPEDLLVSEGTWLTLPYHMALEKARESGVGKKDTTCRGISPTYASARAYQGVRAGDVRDLDCVRRRISEPLSWHNAILTTAYGATPVSEEEVLAEIEAYRARLIPHLGNEVLILNNLLFQDRIILCEGAQSGMLDVDLGIYPNTTASNTWPGSIQSGCGLDPRRVTRDICVVKAYTSRVGQGRLVAEMDTEQADIIRERGSEYGTSTGRPRRIGWTDQAVARYCALIGPPTEVAVTKADILTGINPLFVCAEYILDGEPVPIFPASEPELNRCRPMFRSIPGWEEDITGLTDWEALPRGCQYYLEEWVAKPYRAPITMVGTGPGREQIIVR